MRDFINGLGGAMFAGLLTPQGILIEANRAALIAAGVNPDEVLNRPFEDLEWWAYSDEVRQQLREAIVRAAGGVASRYNVKVRTGPHHLSEFDFSLEPLRDETGAVCYLIPTANLSTERERAADALRESNERFAGAFEQAPIGVALVSPDGRWQKVNRALCELVGYTESELLRRTFQDITHPDDLASNVESLRKLASGEIQAYQTEKRYLHARGHIVTALLNVSLVRDRQGSPLYFVTQIQDISERKRMEQALRESNDNFRQMAANITDAFWIRSPDMREVHYVSPAFERIWGRPTAMLYADPAQWAEFTFPEDRERVVAAFAMLTGPAPSLDIEYRIVRPDGDIRWVRARGFQIRDAAGALIRLTGIVTDITEKRLLESQFLRAQRMEGIGTLAGGIAHDLNNVLAPILMAVTLLKELVRDDDGVTLLTTLQSSAQRGAELVRQVLSFARGVEGQRITVDPLHLMRDLLAVMRDTFAKSIVVRFVPAEVVWTVTGDPTQMHQVFLNLCVNARDAMPGGGRLTISVANVVLEESDASGNPDFRAGAYVMVKVADTGSGIPVAIRERIFEPFFTTKGVGEGTGLGLSTTLAIVKSHAGFIDLQSEVGVGTTFTVYLPANTAEVAAASVAPEPVRLPRGRGELILMVDDEEAIRKIGKRMLERYGYRVLLAGEGAEAVALYGKRREDIALVLTDMAMPIMDGPALILALRKMNPGVRIIGCSGLMSEGGLGRAFSAGIQHFVPKPYTAEAMLNMLREALSR